MAQDATLVSPAFTVFLTEVGGMTAALRSFQSDLNKRFAEQGEALATVSEALGGRSGGKGLKELLLEKSRLALDYNQALLDLQIDEDLSEGTVNNIRASAKRVSGAQKESLSSVAGVYSELFSQLKTDSLFKADGIGDGEREFQNIAEQIIKGATALQLQPQALARAVVLAARHADVANADLKAAANVLALTAQKAKLAPGEIERSFPKFQLAVDGLGLKGLASVTEFGALAQVSKDFGGSWARRSQLVIGFIGGLKQQTLADGRSLNNVIQAATASGKSPMAAVFEALALEKDQGAGLLDRSFGVGTEARKFADHMMRNGRNFSTVQGDLSNSSEQTIDAAALAREQNMKGAVDDAGGALSRLGAAWGDSLSPLMQAVNGGISALANSLSGAFEQKPGLGLAAAGGILTTLVGGYAFFRSQKSNREEGNSRAPAGIGGNGVSSFLRTLSAPLPVYVVNLPGAGFEGRGLTPLLDGPGGGRRRGSVPPAGGLGTLAAEVGERVPLSRGGGLFSRASGLARGLLGRVVRPLGMIDDVATVASAAARGDRAGVGRGLGSGLGGLGGAMLGASIGSVIPVAGTLIGGLIGGALGSFGGSSLLERVMGGGGEAAGPPVPPLQAEALASKPESFADQLHKLAIELSISGLPDGATAHARCRWDDFVEAAYLGVNIHNGLGNLRAGGPR